MDYSLAMAAYVGGSTNQEGRSALPDAPVVAPRNTARIRRRIHRFRGRLASLLHRAAIEPVPRNEDTAVLTFKATGPA